MDIERSAQPDGSALAFLVERYLPRGSVDDLAPSVRRVARLCAPHGVEGVPQGVGGAAVRYVQSIYLPGDDICFCLFQAASGDAVRAVNAAGEFPLDRVTAAVLMIAPRPAATSPVGRSGTRRAPDHRGPWTSA